MGDRITSLGVLPLEALGRAYAAASLVFLPTLREASTAVYPEAFHFRRPLVTSDLDFAHELCGDAAAFVPPLDPIATARTITGIAADRAWAERLIDAGERQLAAGYPSPARKLEMQLNLLERLATRRPPSTQS
jgi:glycosyltransferase involved in cell wall biosynthesis